MHITHLQTGFFAGIFLLVSGGLSAQISPDCNTAIPICNNTPVNGGTIGYGVDDYGGATESGCLEPTTSGYIESNSAWYRFRTGASGQLGFNISFDASEDWDFALYRTSDCGSLGEPVRCNFYDNRDREVFMGVGEDPSGSADTYLYEPWLDVQPGEDYYLMINNYSNTNSGFSIQFSGRIFEDHPYDALDCSIISNLLGPPVAACEGDTILLDGTTAMATAYQWFADTGSGFNTLPGENGATHPADSPAVYRIRVSLPDGSQVISDVQVGFSPAASTQPISDEAICSDQQPYDLRAKDAGALGSLNPAEFRVSYHTSAFDAQAGIGALPAEWSPGPGTHTVYVRTTSLENPNCYDSSEQFDLQVLSMPLLDFEQQVFICENGGSAVIGQLPPDPAVSYRWDDGRRSALRTVTQPGTYTLTATTGSGPSACSIQRSVEVILSVPPGISGIIIEDFSAANRVTVETDAVGDFEYALDNGPFQANPVFEGVPAGSHQVRMRDRLGCGEITETITVVGYLPFFTPNGDGQHDTWQIQGLETLTDPVVHIFDRYGKLLKQLDRDSPGWDGTYLGRLLPGSDYWFRLSYLDASGQRVEARYLNAHFALKR
ncbi:T9SS type B sorting domain-containing protein [Robiginitalea sp. SC105]|uniref:T9SS type B sorting domain-containing protein n=1 Tax=Robiginitalea sp. SC105 TaxID=2762332 RepID=UPI00163A12D9|nr:T9SS type B sorting domain-containing protein [Robiginitalea sp. SC105]MBC2839764.1 T9SS type B sorting domain-containing protein [Robiginitalea sp. SC105]